MMMVLQLSDLSISDLKKTIKQYQSLDFNINSIADADKLLRMIIKHFVTETMIWDQPIIFRARKNIDNELFANVEELLYHRNPPSYGRLNDIGESIFYGASNADTTLLEMRLKEGDEITILESRLINPKVL